MSEKEEKALIESIDFECPSCAACFSEEPQWITDLLKANKATCPHCESKLLIGTEDKDRLASVMKKKERFGKAMFAFMVPYAIGGLIVSLYFGGLGFLLYMPVGLGIFSLLKMLFDNQPDLTISLNPAT
ncbi:MULTISPECIES: hypothetical protein [unclassified Halomonas]|uniref:hypothetical protein n=1 Tax=unclassified Halomonas TaxID=2609666 RepID=UPI00099082F5|nr:MULTISPECIES: hypothetical protein [unclassified Halomonas]AQU83630.1 hypothetical protein B2G49_14255 [Halomonas sp. 'Soap Lake \